jgi:hypothetical protein
MNIFSSENSMGDFKSKLPDFQEIIGFTGKLLKDVKKSVGEIVDDYKLKRAQEAAASEINPAPNPTPTAPETPPIPPATKPIPPVKPDVSSMGSDEDK